MPSSLPFRPDRRGLMIALIAAAFAGEAGAVAGRVGRVDPNRSHITAPTATVRNRGTGGRIALLLARPTLVAATSAIWTLGNPWGTILVPAGTSRRGPATPGQRPQQTTEQPKPD